MVIIREERGSCRTWLKRKEGSEVREGMEVGMVHDMAVFCLSPCFNHHRQVLGLVQES
jgi:hypothetical protein